MKQKIASVLLVAGVFASAPSIARDVSVEITNLTNGTYFTPLLEAALNRDTHLFQTATPASANLQAMAEGGNISGLASDVHAAGGSSWRIPPADRWPLV